MVLRMARPSKHPTSGVYYVRERVPRDVLTKARGRKLVFPNDAGGGSGTVSRTGEHVKASLRTREPHVAKERHAAALGYLGKLWAALRSGPRRLARKETVALAGEAYRAFAEGFEDDPGRSSQWREVQAMNAGAVEGTFGIASLMIGDEARRVAAMEERFGALADGLLASKGLVIDADSRRALLDELARALTEAAGKLERNADGDYSLDPIAKRFPAWMSAADAKPTERRSITKLYEGFLNVARGDDPTGALRALKNRVTEFVRGVITDTRVAPNHGWRHKFITLSRRHGMDQEKRRMITGHAGEGVDEHSYGDPEGLYEEVCKLPRFEITDSTARSRLASAAE